MKVVIDNQSFPYDIGLRLIKLKRKECPFEEIKDVWNDIVPMTFAEIAQDITNLEQRRVAINCLGIERIYKEVGPELVNKETISKTSTWINSKGDMETVNYDDTYELYKVSADKWASGSVSRVVDDVYFVKCKDTSTDREYFIWVDISGVKTTNFGWSARWNDTNITAIQAIAWTIQTDIPEGFIEKMIRQGDCILIKPKSTEFTKLGRLRHLTESEYRTLLVLES